MRELNKIYCDDWLNNGLPDKCAKLIIMDCPYFEVKGDFDFVWKTFDDYLADVEKWAIECKRVLADNGTLFWYGDSKNIAYTQVLIDNHFNLINNLVWNKGSFMGLEESEGLRSFAPCTERILMYGNLWDVNSLDEIMFNKDNFKNIKQYLKAEKQKVIIHYNFTPKEFNDYTIKLGCSTTPYKNWFCNTGFWEMATKKMYEKLQKSGFFERPYDEIKTEYESLRTEYESLRRYFDNKYNLQEILNFNNEAKKTGSKYDHDTVKPETLTRALMLTTTRKKDLVVIPMAGSGTECAMAAYEGRPFYGFDIKQKYVDMGNKRISKILKEPQLF